MTATHKFPMPTVSFDLTSSALLILTPPNARDNLRRLSIAKPTSGSSRS